MRLRAVLVSCAVVIGLIAIAGCGGGSSSSSSDGGGSGGGSESSDASVSTYVGLPTEEAEIFTQNLEGVNQVATTAGGGKATTLNDGFDPQKQLQLFSTLFSKGCEDCALSVTPISPSNQKPIVTQAERAGAYVSFLYLNIPGYFPWSAGPNYVAFTAFDGEENGENTAKALFESMGGKGNIVEIDGTAGPGPGGGDVKARGLHNALKEFPEINVLEAQAGEWEQEKAQSIMQTLLAKYGDEIDGVWCANDGMAIGVVQALKAQGLNGKVGVTGMDGANDTLALVKSGEMTATTFDSGALIGAVTTALSTAAAKGDIDPEELTHEQRFFYLKHALITKDNVDEFYKKKDNPIFKFSELSYPEMKKNLWKFSAGPIPEEAAE